jgi:hypothetical protein
MFVDGNREITFSAFKDRENDSFEIKVRLMNNDTLDKQGIIIKINQEFIRKLDFVKPGSPYPMVDLEELLNIETSSISTLTDQNLNYDFLELSYPRRMRLLTDNDLLRDGDSDLNHVDLIKEVIRRARERGFLEEFEQLVQQAKYET